ncbi:DNA topology modulation protein [Paenibacillus sp. WLX1005]|uniref:DNA topology modulation protein n=1 Tax=Paenibacillus sp. WLX1005 TaxID=3243766 RepID=UPI0039844D6A
MQSSSTMQKIMIIGCSGAGKSTLSRKLHETLHIPVIHMDAHFWQTNWQATEDEEWDRQVEAFAQADCWIIDGNYGRTMDIRIQHADTIIYLDMPRWLCLYRVIKRRIQYHGKSRPDMNAGCNEKIDWAFIKWIWNYRKRSRLQTLDRLRKVEGDKQIITIRNSQQLHTFLKQLSTSSVIV